MLLDYNKEQKAQYEAFENDIEHIFIPKWNSLNEKQKNVFLLLCCERAFPFYYEFSEIYKFGKAKEIRKIINSLWNSVLSNNVDTKLLKKLQEKLLKPTLCPHLDEYSEGSSALDACSILWETMEYMISKDEAHFKNAHSTIINSLIIKEILYSTNLLVLDYSQLLSQPLMKAEIEIQLSQINLLINISK